jgi:hypothetical protein
MPSPSILHAGRAPRPPTTVVPVSGRQVAPAAPLARQARHLAAQARSGGALHDASVAIPPYGRRKRQYSAGEWAEISAAFLPGGATTRIDRERLTALADGYARLRDEGSNRHVGRLAQVLGARVRRHLASLGRRSGRTQDTLRTVLQREYLPARTRLELIARAVGDPAWPGLAFAEKWARVGDLLEAIPIIEAELDDLPGAHDGIRKGLMRRKRERFGLDIAEALQDHFAAQGAADAAALTRAIHERLAAEGVVFRRCSPGWYAFGHLLTRRPDVTVAAPEVFLAWLMRSARHPTALGAPSYRSGPLELRQEADATVAWARDDAPVTTRRPREGGPRRAKPGR